MRIGETGEPKEKSLGGKLNARTNSLYSQPTYGITSSILLVGYCPPGCTILTQISIIIVARVIVVVLYITGLSFRGGGRRFPQLLYKENRRKIEPKQALSCLIPCLLFVCIRQLKISDNAVLATRFQGLKPKKQD